MKLHPHVPVFLAATLLSLATFTSAPASAGPVLLLYSAESPAVFLGCLSCDAMSPDSIWNTTGTYGSKYSATSIWNRYGSYGSPYQQQSVCNSYTTSAPVVVDSAGSIYGRLTKNKYAKDAVRDSWAQTLIATVCG